MQRLHTPCFIIDNEEFSKSILEFQEALSQQFTTFAIGYSVKTNSLPYCLKLAREYGCYAEVVSFDEYNLALRCGYAPKNIIYNGPMKSKETFLEAIINGATVNIDTWREIDWLLDLPKNRIFNIGIRLNVNLSKVFPVDAQCEDDNSRFGFSDQTNDFCNVLKRLQTIPNIKIAGLHIHRTTHSRSVDFYYNLISYASQIIKKYQLSLDYLDIGGGYYGIFKNKPTYQDYCKAISKSLQDNNIGPLKIIIEPGNGIVASAFSFLTEIIDIKHTAPNLCFVTTDGSRNDIDPLFKKTDYIKDIIYRSTNDQRDIIKTQNIVGCTCLEFDRMFTLNDSYQLIAGDRILYKNVGAYTMCLSPLFIRYFPKVYSKQNDRYKIVREQWTEQEYLNLSHYYE